MGTEVSSRSSGCGCDVIEAVGDGRLVDTGDAVIVDGEMLAVSPDTETEEDDGWLSDTVA